jgi:hypothetical protein
VVRSGGIIIILLSPQLPRALRRRWTAHAPGCARACVRAEACCSAPFRERRVCPPPARGRCREDWQLQFLPEEKRDSVLRDRAQRGQVRELYLFFLYQCEG